MEQAQLRGELSVLREVSTNGHMGGEKCRSYLQVLRS